MKECTFKPKVNTNYRSTRKLKGDFLARQRNWQKQRQRELTEQRAKFKNGDNLGPDCTFKPNLSFSQKKVVGKKIRRNTKKALRVGVRLFAQAREKIIKRTQLADKLREETFMECTFTPTITKNRRLMKDDEPI